MFCDRGSIYRENNTERKPGGWNFPVALRNDGELLKRHTNQVLPKKKKKKKKKKKENKINIWNNLPKDSPQSVKSVSVLVQLRSQVCPAKQLENGG